MLISHCFNLAMSFAVTQLKPGQTHTGSVTLTHDPTRPDPANIVTATAWSSQMVSVVSGNVAPL